MSNNNSLLQNISDLELTIKNRKTNPNYPWENLRDKGISCLSCSSNPCICQQSKQQNNQKETNDKLLSVDNNFDNLEVNKHPHLHHNHLHHNHSHGEFHFHALPAVSQIQVEEVAPNPEISLASTSLDLSQTFFLNSNPGAKHTIYLDFDGHTTTNTSWNSQYGINSIYTPAYDIDGNVSSFSDSELTRIQHIWQRVAEDFLPFDVNVTTEDPGTDALRRNSIADQTWGTRVAIGGNSRDWFGANNAGGVAYIGSFDWFSDTPAFVFEENLSNGNEKFIAEAITHEVGHTLGLNHDGIGNSSYYSGHGSGATGWAPILGTAYYKEVTQWSRGDYNNANNQEDDLNIITKNGFGYREDDHGDTNTSATALNIFGQNFTGNGIIERNTDYDVFSFTTDSGTVSLDILPGQRGANLDILALLYDAQGNLIASSNPFEQLSANFNLSLEAGEYYLHVTGTGKEGAYSDYGSLGQYSINGTVVATEPDFVSIEATNANLQEGNNGNTAFTFTITRTGNLNQTTSVEYQVTGNGSNPANSDDFVAGVLPNGIVDFGVNESSKVITINVNGDLNLEEDESFTVRLQNPTGNTVISDANAHSTIINDDFETEENLDSNSGDIVGTVGNDQLIGSFENERFIPLDGTDTITTGEGNDVIVINTFDEGLDHILDFDPTQDTIDITGVLDSIGYTGDDPFADNVLRLQPLSFGGEHHVRLDVDADANYGNGFEQLVFLWDTDLDSIDTNHFITTSTSINGIVGTVGNDQLIGSSENERFIPLDGTDTITTGEGNDVIVINTPDEGLDHVLDFDPIQDKIDISGVLDSIGYTGDDPFTDKVLRLQPLSFGGEHHVRLDVDADANYGNGFEQLVFLWDTNLDTLNTDNNFITSDNNQTPQYEDIIGSAGNDQLTGLSGNDRIVGLDGSDQITTGSGNDLIVFNSANEGLDHILDFDPNQDKIDIVGVLDSIGYTGNDPLGDKVIRLQPLSFGGSNHVRLDVDADANYGNGFEQLAFLWDTNITQLDVADNLMI